MSAMSESFRKFPQYLLTGVSHAIPFIACGGILIAVSIACVPMTSMGPDFSHAPVAKLTKDIGAAAFYLVLPILAGHIAVAMAGKPGLLPGFLGGYLADQVNAGFLGALLAGLLAGSVVNLFKAVPVPNVIRPVMPILVVPVVSSLVVGAVMLKVIGLPIAGMMGFLSRWLASMSSGNEVLLGAILGAMIAIDLGGPINKAAYFFGAAMLKEGNFVVMGACAAAICTPPLGMGLATLINRNLWTAEQRKSGLASLAMGAIGITEGAIPFAAGDPLRVIPCTVLGSVVSAILAILGGVGDHAPHGGPIVLPLIDHRLGYLAAMTACAAVTALAINFIKSPIFRRATVDFLPPP